jgi:hypothetical protein
MPGGLDDIRRTRAVLTAGQGLAPLHRRRPHRPVARNARETLMPPPTAQHDDRPLQRLLAALPSGIRRAYEWLRKPGRIWLRIPLALLLIAGGFLGFLPILGFWMVPLGAVLLAEDVPFLRRPTMRALAAVQGWWDRYRARRRKG